MKTQKLKAERHIKNIMPEKATLEQRIELHLEHVKDCACRPIPDKLKLKIE